MNTYNSITAAEMWSHYLFNQGTPKTGVELLDETVIRNGAIDSTLGTSIVKGDTITLSAKDFMETEAGRFVNGANFGVVKNFFSDHRLTDTYIKDMAKANGKIDADGNISLSLEDMLYISSKIDDKKINTTPDYTFDIDDINSDNLTDDDINIIDTKPFATETIVMNKDENGFYKIGAGKPIKQTYFKPDDENDIDFFTRVELFETTRFQIGLGNAEPNPKKGNVIEDREFDPKIEFIITADGEKYITNFVITPSAKGDNFDFIGGNGSMLEESGNQVNMFMTDPSDIRVTSGKISGGLGRTFNIDYDLTTLESSRKTYTYQDFLNDRQKLDENNYSENRALQAWRLFDPASQKEFFKDLYTAGVISYKDDMGRTVYYGTGGEDEIDLNAVKMEDLSFAATALYSDPNPWFGNTASIEEIEDQRLDNFGIKETPKITFVAGQGNDTITGLDESAKNPDDRIFGGSGNDVINGLEGNDHLYAGSLSCEDDAGSENTLIGGKGSDHLYGATGDDTLIGGISKTEDDGESDYMQGGDGFDTYYVGNKDVIFDAKI